MGSGSEIGANSYLITCGSEQIVLDCGLHPKLEGRPALPDLAPLRGDPAAVIVSHAHIDHCGAVPYLLKQCPATVCYSTQATLNLMDRMLHNSVAVMGTLSLERGISDYPLYRHGDVESVIRRAYGLSYHREFALDWDSETRATFIPSGHVLGSAGVLLRMPGHTLYYTSDVCLADQELLGGMEFPDGAAGIDTLVVESTRGAQEDGHLYNFQSEVERLVVAINGVLDADGVVLIPSFALGRTQELLNVIARLIEEERIPDVPVYASGLGRAVYEVYSKHARLLKPDAVFRPLHTFKRIGDVWERQVRRDLVRERSIIVATSGMMIESTPSAMIAQELVRDTRHGIFFAGYLDPDTLGYKLLNCAPGDEFAFEYMGRKVEVALQNMQRFHFSAHAHRDDLLRVVQRIRPKNVVFVHGDDDAVSWMHDNCQGDYAKHIPDPNTDLVLEA